MKVLDRFLDRFIVGTSMTGPILLLGLALLITLQFLFRYFLNISLRGALDACVYVLVVFPFLTTAYVQRAEKHIIVDVVTTHLPERARAFLKIATYLVAVIYPILFGWKVVEWTGMILRSGQRTSAVWPIPVSILTSIMILGYFLLAYQVIRMVVRDIRSLPGQTASTRLRDNPWLYVSLFIIGIVACILIFTQVNPILGLFVTLLFLLFAGIPVFFTFGLVGVLGLYLSLNFDLSPIMQLPITAYSHLYSFPLTCLPLFILGGAIMEKSKIIDHVFTLFQMFSGKFTSSLLFITLLAGGLICSTTGSTVGATAVITAVAFPILRRNGFKTPLCCGLIAGCTVGTLVPPSIGYVITGTITDTSIGQLFIAALLPCAVLWALYFAYVFIISLSAFKRKTLYEEGQGPIQNNIQLNWKGVFAASKKAVWGIMTPVIVLGGIYSGAFTATESAGVLVIYAIIVAVFVTRAMNWRDILKTSLQSTLVSSMLLCLILAAYGLALVIAQLRIAPGLIAFAEEAGLGQLGVLVLLFIVLTILGLFLDAGAIKVITLPMFFPLAMSLGIDALWLGIFYQINSEIGGLTPPVGFCLFVIAAITGVPLSTVTRGCMPFVLMMVLLIIIIYLFPGLCTWLPSRMIP